MEAPGPSPAGSPVSSGVDSIMVFIWDAGGLECAASGGGGHSEDKNIRLLVGRRGLLS